MILTAIYFQSSTKNGRKDGAVKIVCEWTGRKIKTPVLSACISVYKEYDIIFTYFSIENNKNISSNNRENNPIWCISDCLFSYCSAIVYPELVKQNKMSVLPDYFTTLAMTGSGNLKCKLPIPDTYI